MNESIPEAAPLQPNPSPAYEDRSTGLTIFGILTLLLGGVCALLVPLIVIGQMAVARVNQSQASPAAVLLLVIALYGGLGVALIWLGIGSIMARRWARALLLIFSWTWLIMGVISVASMAFVMPRVLAQQTANGGAGTPAMPGSVVATTMFFMLFFMGIFFILLPLIWIVFYKSPHVKATCEARDPVRRWTDACPLPVLAVSLWLLVSVPMLLLMPISAHGVLPFFGMFLSGLPGSLVCLGLAALWAYIAWLLYKLDVRGWWLVLFSLLAMFVSAVLTYAQHDMLEAYQLMGYPQAQIDQMRRTGLLTGQWMVWIMVLCMVPWLAYVLFIKRYFEPKTPG